MKQINFDELVTKVRAEVPTAECYTDRDDRFVDFRIERAMNIGIYRNGDVYSSAILRNADCRRLMRIVLDALDAYDRDGA